MLYQYSEDFSGKVVAQKRKCYMPNYLNHRFPAMDTPPAVRNAYLQRPIRYIPNVNYDSKKLIKKRSTDKYDLTRCILRGVEPMHIEFLINMGSASVMSLAVIVDNHLWGIIACHHKTEKHLTIPTRKHLLILTSILANRIRRNAISQQDFEKNRILKLISMFSKKLSYKTSMVNILSKWQQPIMKMIKCNGYVSCSEQYCQFSGDTLHDKDVVLLFQYGVEQDGNVITCDKQQLMQITDHKLKNIASAMLIVIDKQSSTYVILLRNSVASEEKWAGDPNKHLTVNKKSNSYHPRKSFKTWVATHQSVALPWTITEKLAAKFVQKSLREIHIQKQLAERAFYDALTGLYNRHYLEDAFISYVRAARRNKSSRLFIPN